MPRIVPVVMVCAGCLAGVGGEEVDHLEAACDCDVTAHCSLGCACDEDCLEPGERQEPPLEDDPETTSCSVRITPEDGTTATPFAAELASNGAVCRATYDAVEPGPIDCAPAPVPFLGADIGVGAHTVTMFVDDGPSGPSQCSAAFTVREGTTCEVRITPETGTTADAFAAEIETNGTVCRAAFDLEDLGPVDCATPAVPFLGADAGVGLHTVTLSVDEGPSGPAECDATFSVESPVESPGR